MTILAAHLLEPVFVNLASSSVVNFNFRMGNLREHSGAFWEADGAISFGPGSPETHDAPPVVGRAAMNAPAFRLLGRLAARLRGLVERLA